MYSGRFRWTVAPHLPTQKIQKDGCVAIKTLKQQIVLLQSIPSKELHSPHPQVSLWLLFLTNL